MRNHGRTYLGTLLLMLCSACSFAGESLYEKAYAQEVAGKFVDAAKCYQQVLNDSLLHQDWPRTLFRLANTYVQLEQYKKSVDTIERLSTQYPADQLTPEGLWLAVTLSAGVLNDRASAIKFAKFLQRQYPRSEYGERASFGQVFLYYANNDKSNLRTSVEQYKLNYPSGKFMKSVRQLEMMIERKSR